MSNKHMQIYNCIKKLFSIMYSLVKKYLPSMSFKDNSMTFKQVVFCCVHLLPCVIKR